MRKAAGHVDVFKRRSDDISDSLTVAVRPAELPDLTLVLSDLYNLLKRSEMLAHRADYVTSTPRYLTTEEAAAYMGVSPSWLNRAKLRNEGPVWISLGNASGSPVRYDVQDLDNWMRSRRFATNAEASKVLAANPIKTRQPTRKIELYKRPRRHS
jgi:hypothetical protein